MGLAPGDDEPVKSEAIHLSEDAFFLVEFGVVQHVPTYRNFGHWGVTRVPSSVWIDVLDAITDLRKKIEKARGPSDLSFEGMSVVRLMSEFRSNFELTKSGAVEALRGVSQVTGGWLDSYDGVFIIGI